MYLLKKLVIELLSTVTFGNSYAPFIVYFLEDISNFATLNSR